MTAVDREKARAKDIVIQSIIALVTGAMLAAGIGIDKAMPVREVLVITHLISATIVCALFLYFCYLHLVRTLQSRRNSLFFSGLLLTLVAVLCLATGILLTSPSRFSIDNVLDLKAVHLYTAIIVILFYGFHAYRSRVSVGVSKLRLYSRDFSVKQSSVQVAVLLCVTLIILAPILLFKEPATRPVPEDYDKNYGDNPFAPGMTTTDDMALIGVHQIASSAKCSSCHEAIFEQWRTSMHRLAAADPAYVKNVNLLEQKKGIFATRYCEGCHAPVAMLTGELTTGGKHGGTEGTPGFDEGVSCLSCHRVTAVNSTEGVASYHYTPAEESPILSAQNNVGLAVAGLMTFASPAKHKSLFNNHIVEKPESCATCHAQFMDERMNGWGWIKMQDDYTEWLESPFAGQGDNNFAQAAVTRCQDCHMPLVKAQDPSADEHGMVRSHNFHAANTVVQEFFGHDEALDNTINFLKSDKLRVAIEPPKANNLTNQNATINPKTLKNDEIPFHFYAGHKHTFSISVANVGVGHSFPGGTTDVQEAWLTLDIIDASGVSILKKGGEQNPEDALAIYKTTPVDRFGKAVWRHDLFNSIGDSFKNVIKAGKTDVVTVELTVPRDAKGPVTVAAALRYKKFNHTYGSWVFEGKAVDLTAVEIARDTVNVPLLIEPPATTAEVTNLDRD